MLFEDLKGRQRNFIQPSVKTSRGELVVLLLPAGQILRMLIGIEGFLNALFLVRFESASRTSPAPSGVTDWRPRLVVVINPLFLIGFYILGVFCQNSILPVK
ncbi:hypothetical protein DK37_00920 [Halomonas sp. SUBG004]|nr:hypothetical protein DK37_00920 [Halomonas sp. SUBG004]